MRPIPVPKSSSDGISVHLLTNRKDWRMAAWSIASFLKACGRTFPVVVHDDGSLQPGQAAKLERLFPGLRIIWRPEADRAVVEALAGRPQSLEFRSRYNNSIKLFDPWLVAGARDVIALDSDLIFFRKPEEILAWVDGPRSVNRWNEDVESAYTLTHDEIRDHLGVEMIPRINSGLGVISGKSMDWDLVEKALEHPAARSHHWRIEQTLFAILSCRFGVELLSPKHRIDISRDFKIDDTLVNRHYVGAVRDLMYTQGMKRLLARGILDRA
ncbi:MAG: hypothetical protein ABIW76_13095 [Fibrobacteria bacterium]